MSQHEDTEFRDLLTKFGNERYELCATVANLFAGCDGIEPCCQKIATEIAVAIRAMKSGGGNGA